MRITSLLFLCFFVAYSSFAQKPGEAPKKLKPIERKPIDVPSHEERRAELKEITIINNTGDELKVAITFKFLCVQASNQRALPDRLAASTYTVAKGEKKKISPSHEASQLRKKLMGDIECFASAVSEIDVSGPQGSMRKGPFGKKDQYKITKDKRGYIIE